VRRPFNIDTPFSRGNRQRTAYRTEMRHANCELRRIYLLTILDELSHQLDVVDYACQQDAHTSKILQPRSTIQQNQRQETTTTTR
jgi:hypothetical protein